MKSLELFSGAGGLAIGLAQTGFQHVGLVEFNRDACQTLRTNFDPKNVFEGDIRDYDFTSLDHVDLVAGGPPCQPFSLGGKHKASTDSRDMFPYALKAITQLKPKAFIFENVKGLLRSSFAEYLEFIILRLKYPTHTDPKSNDWHKNLEKLRDLDACAATPPEYQVQYRLINTANFGIPQTRERVIIVGIRSDQKTNWSFPKEEHSLEQLLWEQYITEEYWERHNISKPLEYSHTPHFMRRIEQIRQTYGLFPPSGKPWVTMRDVLGHLPDPTSNHNIPDHVFRDGARSYAGHTGSMFDLPSKTIKAGAHGVPGGENMIRFSDDSIRYLTVHEAKLIQGFPKDYQIHGAWGEAMRQIGNAVPSGIGKLLGESLMKCISKTKKKPIAA